MRRYFQRSQVSRRATYRFYRSSSTILRLASLAMLSSLASAQAPDSYYANSGSNNVHDLTFGEFGKDLGGYIPFSRFEEPTHYFKLLWDNPPPINPPPYSFREEMLRYFTLLDKLKLDLDTYCFESFPATGTLKWEYDSVVWWAQPPAYIHVWAYDVNGGHVQIVARNMAVRPNPFHVLVTNRANHFSYYATAKLQVGESPFPNVLGKNPSKPMSGWTGVNNDNRYSDEQAVERGDFLVTVSENYSADLIVCIQRTQDAVRFFRDEFLPQKFPSIAANLGQFYVGGGSFGGLTSAIEAMLQPAVYDGSSSHLLAALDLTTSSFSGDWARWFNSLRLLANSSVMYPVLSDLSTQHLYQAVDFLGIRFDHPDSFMIGRAWDLANFVPHFRPGTVMIPITGFWGSEDAGQYWWWHSKQSTYNSMVQLRFLKHGDHGSQFGATEGLNQFSPWDGNEWASLIAQSSQHTFNPDLVPNTAPPPKVYADPYAHTVKHKPDSLFKGPVLLPGEIDLNGPLIPGRRIGQGFAPGMFDHVEAADLDGDGTSSATRTGSSTSCSSPRIPRTSIGWTTSSRASRSAGDCGRWPATGRRSTWGTRPAGSTGSTPRAATP